MARTIAEIKKTMTDAFLADADLREAYGLAEGATWDGSFSAVSVENILIYIVAVCCRAVEALFEQWKADVDETAERAVVASVPWYWKKALAFQLGDELVPDADTAGYGYAKEDAEKQVVKYAAVRDRGRTVNIMVSGDSGGSPCVLPEDTLAAFRSYMNRVKVAGAVLKITSRESDRVRITARVAIDPMVLNEDGERLDGGGKPVEEAIAAHLKGIAYGGTLNKTKLMQAILEADGAEDVELRKVEYTEDYGLTWETLEGNNYTGEGGSYTAEGMEGGIEYVVQA